MTFKIDRLDVINESLRLETETLKKELKELTADKNALSLELSAARIQLNYEKLEQDEADAKGKTNNDKFTDELIEKIETLTREKAELAQALELSVTSTTNKQDQASLEAKQTQTEASEIKTQIDSSQQTEDLPEEKSALEAEVEELRGAKLHCEARLGEVNESHEQALLALRSETKLLQETLERETRQSRQELEQLATEMQAKTADLEAARLQCQALESNRQAFEADKQSLSKELSDAAQALLELKLDMGQNSEKLLAVEERCKSIEKERDDLKRKCKEFEARIDVLSRSERDAEKDASDRLGQLEKALEEALVEREEILEAAEKEIQAQKTMAIETEQKMMDDFEWKLREIESEYRDKIKSIEDSVDAKVKSACDAALRVKDEEFHRKSIALKREMEGRIRDERASITQSVETQHSAQRDKAVELLRLEKDHEIRILQKSWQDEQDRLNREIQRMQRQINNLPQDIEMAANVVRAECDAKLNEEKRKLLKMDAKAMEEADKVRLEMSGQLRRVQSQCDQKIAEYEAKLEAAHGTRMSSMFQMKEEVEAEFTERMEQLRDMYKAELEAQTALLEEEQRKSKAIEAALQANITNKQAEIEELNNYYNQREEELEGRINDLLTRLQEQTSLAAKLQAELDEYEWYEEDEEPQARPPSSRSQHRPHSRPPSTKPFEGPPMSLPEVEEPQDPDLESSHMTAKAAHNNYVSMTSLYATAQASTASEVSTEDPLKAATEPPLAEEAFLTTSSSSTTPPQAAEASPATQPQQYTYANPLRFLYL